MSKAKDRARAKAGMLFRNGGLVPASEINRLKTEGKVRALGLTPVRMKAPKLVVAGSIDEALAFVNKAKETAQK